VTDLFKVALPDAIDWCSRIGPVTGHQPGPHFEPSSCLRSMKLFPSILSRSATSVVRSVINARPTALGRWSDPIPDRVASLSGGRLLYFAPDETLSDGAACLQSQGFFDVYNAPPWDTWLCMAGHQFLISWVPPAFLERVDEGVNANPEGCIFWADAPEAERVPFTAFLRQHELV
jgi:hypothetical protein